MADSIVGISDCFFSYVEEVCSCALDCMVTVCTRAFCCIDAVCSSSLLLHGYSIQ